MKNRLKVIGRAGCGKTTYLINNVMDLVKNRIYDLDKITICTFRKSAAEDLINKMIEVYPYIPKEDLEKHIGTIHSQCYRLLITNEIIKPKKNSKEKSTDIMESKDYAGFIKEYKDYSYHIKLRNRDIDIRGMDFENMDGWQDGDLFDLYSWHRNTMTPPEKCYRYPNYKNLTLPPNSIPQFFKDFKAYKKKIGKIDFSDMLQLVLLHQLMVGTPVLIVDEFQDLSPQMFAVFELWSNSIYTNEVVIAGDPHQSIYGFWGGSPNYLLDWECNEKKVLEHSFRLPKHILLFGDKILTTAGMKPELITAKEGCGNCIFKIKHSDNYPGYKTELHLVRTNRQIPALALRLAKDGKVFVTTSKRSEGWDCDVGREIDIANAIIALKNELPLMGSMKLAIMNYFPDDMLNLQITKKAFEERMYIDHTIWNPSPEITVILQSDNPTHKMKYTSELFIAKISGIKNRENYINIHEAQCRKLYTIHAAKGAEAHGVFLHTYITKAISEAIRLPCEESRAEARVWYVGVTRAKTHLYLVQDAGANYPYFPTIPSAPVEEDLSKIWEDDADELEHPECKDFNSNSLN